MLGIEATTNSGNNKIKHKNLINSDQGFHEMSKFSSVILNLLQFFFRR